MIHDVTVIAIKWHETFHKNLLVTVFDVADFLVEVRRFERNSCGIGKCAERDLVYF